MSRTAAIVTVLLIGYLLALIAYALIRPHGTNPGDLSGVFLALTYVLVTAQPTDPGDPTP